jgi:hypothetical protein
MEGDLVFVKCLAEEGRKVPLAGWVVTALDGDVIVGCYHSQLKGISQAVATTCGGADLAFFRVQGSEVSTSLPGKWKGPLPKDLPDLKATKAAWKKIEAKDAEEPEDARSNWSLDSDPFTEESEEDPEIAALMDERPDVVGQLSSFFGPFDLIVDSEGRLLDSEGRIVDLEGREM